MSAFPSRRRSAAFLPSVVCLTLLLPAALALLASCTTETPSTETEVADTAAGEGTVALAAHTGADSVERGRYLVVLTGCSDCHTPMTMGENGPEPDMARFLSGHPEGLELPPAPTLEGAWMWVGSGSNTAFAGPWGTSYAFNLTPDENTGLGIWTEEMFVAALRTGKHMGQSRPIMPPMPWPALAQATDDDLKAIYAYLRSVPPIANRVPEYQPPAAAPAAQPAG